MGVKLENLKDPDCVSFLQQEILQGFLHRLVPEGILLIGKKESLPLDGKNQLLKLSSLGIYQKRTEYM